MWWPERIAARRRAARSPSVLARGALRAGCFEPLYGDAAARPAARSATGVSSVDVPEIDAPNGARRRASRSSCATHLIFDLTGGAGRRADPPAQGQRSTCRTSGHRRHHHAGRTCRHFGINATYSLIEIATGKTVVSARPSPRVLRHPRPAQRFASARGQRDAENRAAKVIADNIRSRLASYFVAGT